MDDIRQENSASNLLIAILSMASAMVYAAMLPFLMDTFSPDDEGALLVYFGFGFVLSAAHFASLSVLLCSEDWKAVIYGFLLVSLLAVAIWFGSFLSDSLMDDWLGSGLMLPALCACLQLPLWLMRVAFGWHIATSRRSSRLHISIANLLWLTASAALIISTTRYACLGFLGIENVQELLPAMISIPVITVVGWLVCIVYHRAMLSESTDNIRFGYWIVATTIVASLVVLTACSVDRSLRDTWEMIAMTTIVIGFAVGVLVFSFGIRRSGRRLFH